MSQPKLKILLVEDDPVLGYVVKDFLQKQDYDVTHCTEGDAAWHQFMKNIYDICLLDVMLPGKKDGMELANSIRKKNENIPIILLSAKNMDNDKIMGFESGADDYIVKPVRIKILIERIKAILRRIPVVEDDENKIFIDDLAIDKNRYTVTKEDTTFDLPKKEFELLYLLAKKPNKVFTRREIFNVIWDGDLNTENRTIDVHIRKIREKIGNTFIKTIKGVGYKFL